ncbi:MAG: hypothetical protein J0L66_17815 [Cytophagales bacterium]|nr:hypothetical protein [Cytophagales bacterium]
MKPLLYKIVIGLAIISILAGLSISIWTGIEHAGLAFILFFYCIRYFISRFGKLKGFSYSTMIFGVVTMAL